MSRVTLHHRIEPKVGRDAGWAGRAGEDFCQHGATGAFGGRLITLDRDEANELLVIARVEFFFQAVERATVRLAPERFELLPLRRFEPPGLQQIIERLFLPTFLF